MTDGVGLAEVDDRHQGVGVCVVCGVGVLFNHALGNGRLSLPLRRARRRIFISMKRQRTSTFLSLLSVSVSFLQISRLFDGFFLSSSFFPCQISREQNWNKATKKTGWWHVCEKRRYKFPPRKMEWEGHFFITFFIMSSFQTSSQSVLVHAIVLYERDCKLLDWEN